MSITWRWNQYSYLAQPLPTPPFKMLPSAQCPHISCHPQDRNIQLQEASTLDIHSKCCPYHQVAGMLLKPNRTPSPRKGACYEQLLWKTSGKCARPEMVWELLKDQIPRPRLWHNLRCRKGSAKCRSTSTSWRRSLFDGAIWDLACEDFLDRENKRCRWLVDLRRKAH